MIHLGDESQQTEVVKKNLNPVWTKHNVLSVPVYDLKTQVQTVVGRRRNLLSPHLLIYPIFLNQYEEIESALLPSIVFCYETMQLTCMI